MKLEDCHVGMILFSMRNPDRAWTVIGKNEVSIDLRCTHERVGNRIGNPVKSDYIHHINQEKDFKILFPAIPKQKVI